MAVSVALMPATPYRQQRISRTRRLSLVRTAAASLVAAIALLLLSTGAVGSTGSGGQTIVVAPGQSLWSIAAANPAGQDPRERVEELISVNHLSPSGDLAAGQELFVPSH